MKEYSTHYDLRDVLASFGIKSKIKQAMFLYLHRYDFHRGNLSYGIGLNRTVEIFDSLTPFEKWFFGIHFKKIGEGNKCE
jgi:hypothetical protein